MNKATGIAAFILGAAVGSGATWYFLKDKYEKLAQEEIDSVKEVFSKRASDISEKDEPQNDIEDVPEEATVKELDSYKEFVSKVEYTDYSTNKVAKEKTEEKADEPVYEEKPYVITPEEFGELDEYDRISLTYYSDQLLADENDELVEDVERVVGFESLAHFGEYEDDSVFVRNDRLKCDYEILADHRKYTDVIKNLPSRGDIL